jgi:hypothetical protein
MTSCCAKTPRQPPSTPEQPAALSAPPLAERLLAVANQSLAQAAATLGRGDLYATLPAALGDLQGLATPQYRRTFVQGCACSTGLAGGGCCPGGASGLAAQTGCSSHGLMATTGALLGAVGVYSGLRVVSNSVAALHHLARVDAHIEDRARGWALYAAQLQAAPALSACRRGALAHLAALTSFRVALSESRHEQQFNLMVPGALQTLAAAAALTSAVGHFGLGSMGMGVVAPALFAAYGFVLAGKHLYAWSQSRPASQGTDIPVRSAFAAALAEHRNARQQNIIRTAAAWTAVGLAGMAGTLVAAGSLVTSGAGVAVMGAGVGAAGWAMWQNSRTRYVPHLPMGEHTNPSFVQTSAQRAATFACLAGQDQAIQDAVRTLRADQPLHRQIAYAYEQFSLPQCGPKANQVWAKMVQKCSSTGRRSLYLRAQMQAALTFCQQERRLVGDRLDSQQAALRAQHLELQTALLAPLPATAIPGGAQPHTAVHTQAATHLANAAVAQELYARRLAVLDKVVAHLEEWLQGPEAALLAAAAPTAEAPWTWVRLILLQVSGTLGDAVPGDFIARHPDMFSQLPTADAWPVNNLYVLPAHHAEFAAAFAPQLDGAFVHAFFNPRRIEAEMDYLLERELAAPNAAGADALDASPQSCAKVAAPAADGSTCCG